MTIDINIEATKNLQSSGLYYACMFNIGGSEKQRGAYNTTLLYLTDKISIFQYLQVNCPVKKPWPAYGITYGTAQGPESIDYHMPNLWVSGLEYYTSKYNLVPILETLRQEDIGCYLREHAGARALALIDENRECFKSYFGNIESVIPDNTYTNECMLGYICNVANNVNHLIHSLW